MPLPKLGQLLYPYLGLRGQSHLSEIVERAKARRQRLGSTLFSACVGFFLPMGMLVLLAAPFFVFIPRRLLWLRHDIEMVTFLAIVFLTLGRWRAFSAARAPVARLPDRCIITSGKGLARDR